MPSENSHPTATHRRKRVRLVSTGSPGLRLRLPAQHARDNEMWFEDGNVTLTVENTQFKVHKGLLTLHSETFRDMLEDSQESTNGKDRNSTSGCQFIEIEDRVDDVKYMLTLLYNRVPRSFYTNRPLSFQTVAMMLRTGFKY